MRKSGFTLIELLVVVAIIAVLVAILLPTLGQAREFARSAGCGSNLRQIGITIPMYLNDFNSFLPPYTTQTLTEGDSFTDLNGTTYTDFRRYHLMTAWSKSGPYEDVPRDGDGFLGRYLATVKKTQKGILGCPSVPVGPVVATLTFAGVEYPHCLIYQTRSFPVNIYNVTKTNAYTAESQYLPLKFETLENPAELVMMCDGSGARNYFCSPDYVSTPEAYSLVTPSPRHNGNINASFLDGHVQKGDMKSLYTNRYFVNHNQ